MMSRVPSRAADLSIVIVSYNVRALLVDCLASIYAGANSVEKEVVVVDNASTDDSVAAVAQRYPQVCIIANGTNIGFPAANNQALPHCTGRVVLFLNPDTLVQEGSLAGLCDALGRQDGPMMAGLDLRNLDGSQQNCAHDLPSAGELFHSFVRHGSAAIAEDLSSSIPGAVRRVGWVSGAALALNRAGLTKLGGMDENLFWAEDLDLGLRAAGSGVPVYFLPGLAVTHLVGQSGQQNLALMLYYQHVSKVKLLRKHFGRAPALALAGWFALALSGKICVRAFQRLFGSRQSESGQRMLGYAAALRFLVLKREPTWMTGPARK